MQREGNEIAFSQFDVITVNDNFTTSFPALYLLL